MKSVTFILFAAIAVTFVSAQTSTQPEKAIETIGVAGPQNPKGSSQPSSSQQGGLSANRFAPRRKPFQQSEDEDFVPEDSDESNDHDDDDDDCSFCCESSEEQEQPAEPESISPSNKPNGDLNAQPPAAPAVNAM